MSDVSTIIRRLDGGRYSTSTEGAMKMLFLATAACLVISLSSSAQAQKAKFSDQHCTPYCTSHCAEVMAGRRKPVNADGTVNLKAKPDSPGYRERCMSKCMPMCRELG